MLQPTAQCDPGILEEAADWLVLLQSGEATEQDRAALDRWRQRSAAHEAAWQRAQSILDAFQQVPAKLGRATLSRLPNPGRRELLALLLMAAPGAWLAARHVPWQQWTADLRTAKGERRTVMLADGTSLILNTATAVDVSFTAEERRLRLVAGEVFVTTASTSSMSRPPFLVHTEHGSLRPLGTAFNVHTVEDSTRLAVFEGAVEVRPRQATQSVIVQAGEQLAFTANAMRAVLPLDADVALWRQGMLLARDMRLGDLIAELGRYHPGVLRCDPAVAGLIVSGSFSLTDVAASLALLEDTLPVRIGRATSYWVTVQQR